MNSSSPPKSGNDWFDWYCAQTGKNKKFVMFQDKYVCPCCFMPTLDERNGYEICAICFWEDDGQDNDDADDVRGGPNGKFSLTQARRNFGLYFTMYDSSTPEDFEREKKKEKDRRALYEFLASAMQTPSEASWAQAKVALKTYHDRKRFG